MFNIAAQRMETDTVVTQERFTELIRKETQLETIKKWVTAKTSYNNYVDITDLLVLLDMKKGERETNE